MSIRVKRRELVEGLRAIGLVAGANRSHPVLGSVLIEDAPEGRLDGAGLVLHGTDGHHSLSVEVDALEGEEGVLGTMRGGGAALVDHGRLLRWASGDWAEEVELAAEGARLVVEGGVKASFGIEDAEAFPAPPQRGGGLGDGNAVELGVSALEELAVAASFAEADPKLAGGRFNHVTLAEEGGMLTLASGNGLIGWLRQGISDAPAGLRVEVRKGFLEKVLKLAGKLAVNLSWSERRMWATGIGWELTAPRPEGGGPDVLGWMRGEAVPEMQEVREMINVLPVVESLAGMAGEKSMLRVKSRDGETTAEIDSPGAHASGPLPACFPDYATARPDLLLQALKQVERVALLAEPKGTVRIGSNPGVYLRIEVEGKVICFTSVYK